MMLQQVDTSSAACWIALLTISACDSVRLEELRVPAVVRHDVNIPAVLDCVYEVKHHESDLLTVKWFFKDETQLVYQWGKGLRPTDLGVLKDRLLLDYTVSQHEQMRHQVVVIRNPTIELSGIYICKVATRKNVVSDSKRMLVYAPANGMNLTQDRCTGSSVNLSCAVQGAYPVPRLEMFMKEEGTQNRILLKGVVVHTFVTTSGVYDALAYVQLLDATIQPKTVFECTVTIPNTQYSLKKVINYCAAGCLQNYGCLAVRSYCLLVLLILPTNFR